MARFSANLIGFCPSTQDEGRRMPGAGDREVIFEFTQVGNVAKVTAIDVATGTEATIVGPPNMGETVLKNNALRKLNYVMAKKDGA
jgi:hypothetical protein